MRQNTSISAVFVVLDAVCIAIMQHTGFTKEQFAVIHLGGAWGAVCTWILVRKDLSIKTGELQLDKVLNQSDWSENEIITVFIPFKQVSIDTFR